MACTTILVGKKATYDGSTMIARTEDLRCRAKKAVIIDPEDQPRTYTSVKSHLTMELPADSLTEGKRGRDAPGLSSGTVRHL